MPTITVETFWPLTLLVALPLIWWLASRGRSGVAHSRVTSAAVLRSLVFVAIILALLKPVVHRISEDISVVYAVDVSHSVSRRFMNDALDWIAQTNARHQPLHSRLVLFAGNAELVELDNGEAQLASSTQDTAVRIGAIDHGATNLEHALLTALPEFAPGLAKRVVLFSDGNQTEGNAWRAVLRLREEGARIFAFRATVAANQDAWVERIQAPLGARERSETDVDVTVFSRSAAVARVELTVDQGRVVARKVALAQGANRIRFKLRFPRSGVQMVTAQVSAEGDELPENDSYSEALVVEPRLHALYVEGGESNVSYLIDALTTQGIRVAVTDAEGLANDPMLLGDKDVVILSDVRADSLTTGVVHRLVQFVRDSGGGLIFAAGENTYGKEGFAESQIEEVLPVTFEAKRKHEELDMVVLVDRSSSMRGQKIEVSKSAARATLDVLDPRHRLAVVAFDAKPHDVVPLRKVGDKSEAEELISRMTSNGQTNIYSALLRAQQLLAGSASKTKHIILLSDGLTSPPPGVSPKRPGSSNNELVQRLLAAREAELRQRGEAVSSDVRMRKATSASGFPGIMEELTDAKITLSTVAIGEKPDVEFMANLAKWGGGTSYVTRIDAEVPTLFAAETRRVLNDSIVEGRFRPIVKVNSPALDGVGMETAPELRGYVMTKAKDFSEVLVEVNEDMPLLVETHYGLGRTIAFTSDVKNRWAADWLEWPGYARMWSQVVRHSARRNVDEGLHWTVVREGSESYIELAAVAEDGSFRNDLWPKMRVTKPAGQATVVALRQVAPGRYRGRVALDAVGTNPWRFDLLAGDGLSAEQVARLGSRKLFYSYPDEYRMRPPDLGFLRALSEQTGGTFEAKSDEIFRPLGDGGIVSRSLWPYFAAAALLMFFLDILVRRAPWRWSRSARSDSGQQVVSQES